MCGADYVVSITPEKRFWRLVDKERTETRRAEQEGKERKERRTHTHTQQQTKKERKEREPHPNKTDRKRKDANKQQAPRPPE